MNLPKLIPLLLAAVLVGCGTNKRVLFATHSSLGLDVSGTAQMPNKVSLSYNRYEAAIIPRKTNGEPHSVYGGMDADIKFFEGQTIKQTFATGKAAMLATGAGTNDVNKGTTKQDQNALVFLTATTFGLHLAAGESQMSPSLLLGYRREEAAMIPVPDPAEEVRSVYADILINSAPKTDQPAITTNVSMLNGVRIKQSFATGRAAEALAGGNSDVRQNLDQAAGLDATRAELRQKKADAAEFVRGIGSELDRLNDNKLPDAVAALKSAHVFSESDLSDGNDLRRRVKGALALKIGNQYSDSKTVQQLTDGLAALKNIQN